jgi:hypothetical protein
MKVGRLGLPAAKATRIMRVSAASPPLALGRSSPQKWSELERGVFGDGPWRTGAAGRRGIGEEWGLGGLGLHEE